ncbi:MAG: C40 family peptidase [Thermodesulfobacteriota bacterium]
MANRIILGAALTLAMIFSPGLAQSVPTKTDKKKSSSSKTQPKTSSKVQKETKKKVAARSTRSSRSRKTRVAPRESSPPVRGEMVLYNDASTPKRPAHGVSETPPLMKVIPQRDGRFLLEPLSPKKPGSPLSRNPAPPATVEQVTAAERSYNRFEPWNFSDLILTQARHYRDAPYSRGASLSTSSATDCSGFVQFIYKGFKIDLPRSSAEQAQVGKVVTSNMDFSKLLPGDLLFFRRGGRHIGHAGIYLGEGKMIHASNRRCGVTVTDLRQSYYEGTFVVAKRVFEVKYSH